MQRENSIHDCTGDDVSFDSRSNVQDVSRQAKAYQVLADPMRLAIFRHLLQSGSATPVSISAELFLPLYECRMAVNALIAAGFVHNDSVGGQERLVPVMSHSAIHFLRDLAG